MNRLLIAAAILFAAGSARADVIRTLERGVASAALSKSNKQLYIPTAKGGISLRAASGTESAGVIAVGHAFGSTGFFLRKDGTLSAPDRASLSRMLTKDRVSRANIVYGLRHSIVARRAYEAKLATVDGKVDSILADAKTLGRSKRYGAYLRYEPSGASGGMLVVRQGMSQRAIYLEGSKENGYSLSPADRADVARLLLK